MTTADRAPTELSLQLPHLQIAALAWGDPAHPPLLALHGWLDSAASFVPLAPLLADRFRLVAVDLPGHGRSAHRSPGIWYHYADYLDDIRAILAALGWSRCHLLGHSLGAVLASVYAAAWPDAVERLLLIEGLGPLTAEPADALTQLRRGLAQQSAFVEKTLRIFASIEEAVTARRAAGDLGENAARLLVERGLQQVAGGWSWSSDPRLTLPSPLRQTESQVQAVLRGIIAPTLLVLGEPPSAYLGPAAMQARIASVADLEILRLPGHHHLHMEDPLPIAQAIRAFCGMD